MQIGRQPLTSDVIAPALEDLGQLALGLVPSGDAVFNVEAGFLPYVLDAAQDLACQVFETHLGCEDGVYADIGGFIGSDGRTVDWLGADQNLSGDHPHHCTNKATVSTGGVNGGFCCRIPIENNGGLYVYPG